MKIVEWLDENVSAGGDAATIRIPHELLVNDDPDEIIFYKDINECGLFCQENHPYAKVARYGHWYHVTGQDKKAGRHSDEMLFDLIVRDREKALQIAKEHIE